MEAKPEPSKSKSTGKKIATGFFKFLAYGGWVLILILVIVLIVLIENC